MRPVLITVAGRPVPAFVAMQYLGVVVGLTLGALVLERAGEDPNRFLLAGFALFIPAVISAHAGPALIRGGLRRRAWLLPREGSAFFFALPALVLTVPLAVWVSGLSVGGFLDGVAVAIAAGTIFGRIGCLLGGCCAGRPTHGPFGIRLADVHGIRVRRVPTQLLDAGFAALLLAALLATAGHVAAGTLFYAAAALYGGGRFLTDFTRQQRPPSGGLSHAQYASLILIAGGLGALLSTILYSPI